MQNKSNVVDDFIRSCSDEEYFYYKSLMDFLPDLSKFDSICLVQNRNNIRDHNSLRIFYEDEYGVEAIALLLAPMSEDMAWNGKPIREIPESSLGYPETDAWWADFRKEVRDCPLLECLYWERLAELLEERSDDRECVRQAWAYAKMQYTELQRRGEAVADFWQGVEA